MRELPHDLRKKEEGKKQKEGCNQRASVQVVQNKDRQGERQQVVTPGAGGGGGTARFLQHWGQPSEGLLTAEISQIGARGKKQTIKLPGDKLSRGCRQKWEKGAGASKRALTEKGPSVI